jgi:LmbE family N-acetylglucosaminyl deacetylase
MLKFLFIFAHPDDETVACAGTILQLIQAGHEVSILSVTDGAAGEVSESAQPELIKYGSVAQLRRAELQCVSQFLNVQKLQFLGFNDGQITNQEVWGKLRSDLIEVIDTQKPDFVVTFDHSGWYFHLDHVGVSIATTLAFQQASHKPLGLLLSYVQVEGSKWQYVYSDHLPITHKVNATPQRTHKIKALQLHQSQDTKIIQEKVEREQPHYELYQLSFAQKNADQKLSSTKIFLGVS